MITTTSEFEQDAAWELTILDLAVPLTPLSSAGGGLDLRNMSIALSVKGVDSSDAAVERYRNSLLPLLFGASWKVLDLVVELFLNSSGTPKDRWSIEEKASKVTTRASSGLKLPGFIIAPDISEAIASLYAATKESRHALVHRRVSIDLKTHDLVGHTSDGTSLTPLTREEQLAFCRVSQRLAQAIRTQTISLRIEADLRGLLSVLVRHHKGKVSSQEVTRPPARVIAELPESKFLDVPWIMEKAKTTFPGVTFVDLLLHFPDKRFAHAELESAPQQVVNIDVNALPSWLNFC